MMQGHVGIETTEPGGKEGPARKRRRGVASKVENIRLNQTTSGFSRRMAGQQRGHAPGIVKGSNANRESFGSGCGHPACSQYGKIDVWDFFAAHRHMIAVFANSTSTGRKCGKLNKSSSCLSPFHDLSPVLDAATHESQWLKAKGSEDTSVHYGSLNPRGDAVEIAMRSAALNANRQQDFKFSNSI